ncbi:MAG: hypothetical protein ACI4VN_00770 [Clostridia bacterium]
MGDSVNLVSIPFHTFEHNLDHSIAYAESKKNEAKYMKNFLYRINRYVKKLKAQNPNITKTEVEEIFANDLSEISKASYSGAKITQTFMNYICYDLFDKTPERLDHYLSILNSVDSSFEELKTLPCSTFALTQLYYAAKLKNEFDSSGSDDIHNFLKEQLDKLIPGIKTNISDSILLILQQLDKLDLLSSYLDINSKKMTYLGIPKYAEALVSDNPDHKAEKLIDIFSDPNLVESQTPYNLLTLYSFWVNRYYKELDTYLEAMFVIRDLDLIQPMIDGNFKSPSKDDLKKELVKLNLFYDPTRFVLEMQKAEKLKQKNESEYDISENIYSFSDDTFLYYIQNEYGDKYKQFFDTYIPDSSNDLQTDAKHYFQLYNPIFATYGLKDATMLYLLIGLTENTHYLNAGIVPNRVNNIQNRADLGKFVGIGINNGMTDTFLLHIKRSTLFEFVNNYMVDDFSKSDLPVYCLPLFNGRVDYTNGLYSVPILAPMTDKQKDFISYESSSVFPADSDLTGNKRTLFVNHLSQVMNYDNPYGNKQKFVNIKNGEIFSPSQDFPDYFER